MPVSARPPPFTVSDNMLSDTSVSFLKRLLDTPGPSGFEAAPAREWREEAAKFAKVESDVHGNSMATVVPDGRPTIMLAGHIDEIGVIATYIDDEGFVYIQPIGGWDVQVLVGQRIRFIGSAGPVYGVVGKKPIHLLKTEDREKASKIAELWVDIGVNSR
ncbi:MAG TPA: M42 family peptidase, partial [Gemmatimonadaceae bacterium]|nr:M42 family peptidase [Gemmatimonadaceae bacterium]